MKELIKAVIWMSHSDTIDQLPDRGILLASTEDVKNAAFVLRGNFFGIQFHRGLSYHRWKKAFGELFDQNCRIQQDWTPDSFVEMTVKEIRETVGDQSDFGIIGGVDSTVAAVLFQKPLVHICNVFLSITVC